MVQRKVSSSVGQQSGGLHLLSCPAVRLAGGMSVWNCMEGMRIERRWSLGKNVSKCPGSSQIGTISSSEKQKMNLENRQESYSDRHNQEEHSSPQDYPASKKLLSSALTKICISRPTSSHSWLIPQEMFFSSGTLSGWLQQNNHH